MAPYTVEYRTAAAQQTRTLAPADFLSLTDALRAAAWDPFDPEACEPTPDVHVRRVWFGVTVVGVAFVFVDVEARRLSVYEIRWAG